MPKSTRKGQQKRTNARSSAQPFQNLDEIPMVNSQPIGDLTRRERKEHIERYLAKKHSRKIATGPDIKRKAAQKQAQKRIRVGGKQESTETGLKILKELYDDGKLNNLTSDLKIQTSFGKAYIPLQKAQEYVKRQSSRIDETESYRQKDFPRVPVHEEKKETPIRVGSRKNPPRNKEKPWVNKEKELLTFEEHYERDMQRHRALDMQGTASQSAQREEVSHAIPIQERKQADTGAISLSQAHLLAEQSEVRIGADSYSPIDFSFTSPVVEEDKFDVVSPVVEKDKFFDGIPESFRGDEPEFPAEHQNLFSIDRERSTDDLTQDDMTVEGLPKIAIDEPEKKSDDMAVEGLSETEKVEEKSSDVEAIKEGSKDLLLPGWSMFGDSSPRNLRLAGSTAVGSPLSEVEKLFVGSFSFTQSPRNSMFGLSPLGDSHDGDKDAVMTNGKRGSF